MSNIEHLMENAVFCMAYGGNETDCDKLYKEWYDSERDHKHGHGNADLSVDYSYHATDEEMYLIWRCAYYVMYTLYAGPYDFLMQNGREEDAIRLYGEKE